MSEPVKKIEQTPESYSPKNKPEILEMIEKSRNIEKLVKVIKYKDSDFELVRRLDVLWVGCVDYAKNNTDESDINTTLKRFQELVKIIPDAIKERINPDWSAALSINYNCKDKPCGIMFANESYTAELDKRFDTFTQPGHCSIKKKRIYMNFSERCGKRQGKTVIYKTLTFI